MRAGKAKKTTDCNRVGEEVQAPPGGMTSRMQENETMNGMKHVYETVIISLFALYERELDVRGSRTGLWIGGCS